MPRVRLEGPEVIMAASNSIRETFDDSNTRYDERLSTIETWLEDLVCEVDDAVSSNQSREWLDVQSEFHDSSPQNTLLIQFQCPHAVRVAGYRTWCSVGSLACA